MAKSRDLLQLLIPLLDLPDTDYWSDVGSCDARAILDRGGEQLLHLITAELASWPSMRQQHLAYILGESTLAIELRLLSNLASSEDPDVAFTARESLRSATSDALDQRFRVDVGSADGGRSFVRVVDTVTGAE